MKNKFNHSILVITSVNVTDAVIKFARVAILARLLLPADFGIAATFWITVGILTAITEIGIEKIIIQDKDGNDPHFGAVAQTLLFGRGIIISVLILMFHNDLAVFFDVPEAANEFALLAILPLIKGLEHRDYIRKQRNMEFVPYAIFRISPEIVTLILVYPITMYFSDYRTFVYLAIVASTIRFFISHIIAKAPIRFAWDKELIKRIIRFGWPLMLSSILLVLTIEGDKLVISQYYSKHELGLFAVAFSFATLIPLTLGGVLQQIMLPYFSKIRDEREHLFKRTEEMNQLILWISIPGILIFLAFSSEIINFVYGNKFVEIHDMVKIIAAIFFIRLFRQVPNTLSLALGRTKDIMFSNLFRQVALVISIMLAIQNVDLYWIAATGLVGEILAIMVISNFLYRNIECHYSLWIQPILGFVLFASFSYFLIEQLTASGLQIILFFLVLITATYSAIHVVRKMNVLNTG